MFKPKTKIDMYLYNDITSSDHFMFSCRQCRAEEGAAGTLAPGEKFYGATSPKAKI